MLRQHLRRVWPAYAILLISLTTTLVIYQGMLNQIEWRQSFRFRQYIISLLDGVETRLNAYANLLRGYGALFESSTQVTHEEFRQYGLSSDLNEDHSGIYATGFIERVRPSEQEAFIRQKSEEGYPAVNYSFSDNNNDSYLLTLLDDFISEDVRFHGINIFENMERRQAMETARDNDTPIATSRTQLFTKSAATNIPFGFIVYVPVYKSALKPKTIEERRGVLKGFVFGSFDFNQLWQTIYKKFGTNEINMEVYDGRNPSRQSLCFSSTENPIAINPDLQREASIKEMLPRNMLGREWTFFFSSLPVMDNPPERITAHWLLFSGWGISLLLFGLAWALAQGRWTAESLSEELHLSNRALDEEKKRLAITLSSIADGVIATDAQGNVTLMNPAAEQLTGWKLLEAKGLPLTTVYQVSLAQEKATLPVLKALTNGMPVSSGEGVRLKNKVGEIKLISDTAAPIYGDSESANSIAGLVLVFRDVTNQQKLLEEQVKTSKLESLGIMAGGIAHDFNNLLTGILGNLSLAVLNSKLDSETRELLGVSEKSCLRARDLTSRLLVFSRGGSPIKEIISLSELIADSAHYAVHGSHVECDISLAPDLWPVKVDKSLISQLIHHIVFNAVQASPENGTVKISASNIHLDINHRSRLAPGRYTQISIQDNGHGIPEENLSKIFDPYFTTKAKASGLGLTAAHAIVIRHQGAILVDSKVGNGTLVTMFIPAESSTLPAPPTKSNSAIVANGKGRILIMDDEQLILTTAKAILTRLGYEVTTAKEGSETIQLYRLAMQENRPFAAVILDLTIPEGMGGADVIKELLRLDPSVKAVVSSGYSDDPIMSNYLEYGFSAVAAKPYSVNRISTLLQQLLNPNS